MGFNRFVGWVKNFIHSRKHPAVNMMKGYGRVTLVRRAHSTNDRVERRFAQEGTKLSDTSFLRSASTRLLNKQRIGVAGANVLQIKISKYTGKACTVVPDRLIAFVDGSLLEFQTHLCTHKKKIMPVTKFSPVTAFFFFEKPFFF